MNYSIGMARRNTSKQSHVYFPTLEFCYSSLCEDKCDVVLQNMECRTKERANNSTSTIVITAVLLVRLYLRLLHLPDSHGKPTTTTTTTPITTTATAHDQNYYNYYYMICYRLATTTTPIASAHYHYY